MSAVPAELPATAELPLNSAILGALAVIRLHEGTPESAWELMELETRRLWLRLSGDPQGLMRQSWRGLSPVVRRRLRMTLGNILTFLASLGADMAAG